MYGNSGFVTKENASKKCFDVIVFCKNFIKISMYFYSVQAKVTVSTSD